MLPMPLHCQVSNLHTVDQSIHLEADTDPPDCFDTLHSAHVISTTTQALVGLLPESE
jgi:hypothetical protein